MAGKRIFKVSPMTLMIKMLKDKIKSELSEQRPLFLFRGQKVIIDAELGSPL